MGILLHIPMEAHLVAYMHKDSFNDKDAYRISAKSEFGTKVLNWLEPMPDGVRPTVPEGPHLTVKINQRYTEGRGNWLSSDKCHLLASWVKRNYEREMGFFVRERRLKHGITKLKAVEAWRQMNGINEDMRQLSAEIREVSRKKLA